MDVGIHIPSFAWPDGTAGIADDGLAALASTAEEVGCDSVSVMDLFFQMEALPEVPPTPSA